ncbi:CAP domain-containing protein [Demequina pelophila]|uniref:CAP domain-containing protein n=1 Tax=Demequina pelophila TaxID=1638984 RepID=UPI00078229CE|nr:CAP domain-containing protein [Demequina pelophila]
MRQGTMLGRVLAAVAATAAYVGALSGCVVSTPASEEGGERLARELFDLTNEERDAQGLEALRWSDCLEDKAADRAAPFVDDPDLVHDVLVSTCHEGASAGENLSRSERSAAQVVDAWLGSAGHRANLLSADFEISGVACLPAEEDVYACAQLFEGAAVAVPVDPSAEPSAEASPSASPSASPGE